VSDIQVPKRTRRRRIPSLITGASSLHRRVLGALRKGDRPVTRAWVSGRLSEFCRRMKVNLDPSKRPQGRAYNRGRIQTTWVNLSALPKPSVFGKRRRCSSIAACRSGIRAKGDNEPRSVGILPRRLRLGEPSPTKNRTSPGHVRPCFATSGCRPPISRGRTCRTGTGGGGVN
jgi:hypothetical protein